MTSFIQLAQEYIKGNSLKHWKRSTTDNAKVLLNTALVYIGEKAISEVTYRLVCQIQTDLMDKMGNSRNNKVISFISSVMKEAVKLEEISKNPCEGLKLLREDKPDIKPFTKEELRQVFESCDQKWTPYFKLMAFTGIRPGELNGLKWEDIDLSAGTLRIERNRYRNTEGTTKTKSSTRNVELMEPALEALQEQSLNAKGDYIFTSIHGNNTDYTHLDRVFSTALRKAGIPHRKMYTLRSTYTSSAISAGLDIGYISKQLGHSSLKITLDRYAKFVDNSSRSERSEKFNQWLKSA